MSATIIRFPSPPARSEIAPDQIELADGSRCTLRPDHHPNFVRIIDGCQPGPEPHFDFRNPETGGFYDYVSVPRSTLAAVINKGGGLRAIGTHVWGLLPKAQRVEC